MIGRALRIGRPLVGLALVGLWIVLLRPPALGGPATFLVVRGSSMLPAYQTGDLVILHAESSYRPGEAVAYRVPDGQVGAGRLVFHRIVAADAGGFVAQGDNNPAADPWTPTAADVAGRAWIVVPGGGRIVAAVHQPATIAAFAAALVVGLLIARPAGPRSARGRLRPARTAR